MGGWGSGSYYRMRSSKGMAESSLPLDIRELKRKGLLTPGGTITTKWSRGGNVHSSIGAIVYKDHLLLRYTHKKTDVVEQNVFFTYTPCNYGGERIWFQCPFCGRRCAVIYSYGKYFACRICCNLTYETCNETPRDRRFSKADKLRKRIGAEPGSFNPLPYFKPKGMHQTTWDRIRGEIQYLEGIGFVELGRMLGIHDE
ncbi:MAG: hypothetical protein HOJ48_16350 [Desulfobacula sp.]|jgi:hypothetical protein|nr:hypothetical protein [Desulfobacula sp.]